MVSGSVGQWVGGSVVVHGQSQARWRWVGGWGCAAGGGMVASAASIHSTTAAEQPRRRCPSRSPRFVDGRGRLRRRRQLPRPGDGTRNAPHLELEAFATLGNGRLLLLGHLSSGRVLRGGEAGRPILKRVGGGGGGGVGGVGLSTCVQNVRRRLSTVASGGSPASGSASTPGSAGQRWWDAPVV